MKLVVAMAIEEHRSALRQIFQAHRVLVYSEGPISGFRPHTGSADADNWFVSAPDSVVSHIVFAFVDESASGALLDSVRAWNERERPGSPMHAFQLSVERSS